MRKWIFRVEMPSQPEISTHKQSIAEVSLLGIQKLVLIMQIKKIDFKTAITLILACSVSGCFSEEKKAFTPLDVNTKAVVEVSFLEDGRFISIDSEGNARECDVLGECKDVYKLSDHFVAASIVKDGSIYYIAGESKSDDKRFVERKVKNDGSFHEMNIGKDTFLVGVTAFSQGSFSVFGLSGLRVYTDENSSSWKGMLKTKVPMLSASYSKSGDTLCSGDAAGNLYIWKWRLNDHAVELKSPYSKLQGLVPGIASLTFVDDNHIIAGTEDEGNIPSRVILWRISDSKMLHDNQNIKGARAMKISPDGRTLALLEFAGESRILLLDSKTLEIKETLNQGKEKDYLFRALDFSPDGKSLIVGMSTGQARLYSVK